MTSEIVVALIAFFGTLSGTFGGIMASGKLTNHRLEQLETKVDKLSGLSERMAVTEKEITLMNHRIIKLEVYQE